MTGPVTDSRLGRPILRQPSGSPPPLGHAASHAAGRRQFYGRRDWQRLKLPIYGKL